MGRGLVVAIAAGILGWSGIGIAGNQSAPPTHPAAQAALRYFESVRDRDFEKLLRELRRPAPSPPFRAVILENLPPEGRLSPTNREDRQAGVYKAPPEVARAGRQYRSPAVHIRRRCVYRSARPSVSC